MFINRYAELANLEARYRSERAELFVLYGRRRVGKTELLRHFCASRATISRFCGPSPKDRRG
jgi:hypothetical protein